MILCNKLIASLRFSDATTFRINFLSPFTANVCIKAATVQRIIAINHAKLMENIEDGGRISMAATPCHRVSIFNKNLSPVNYLLVFFMGVYTR